MLGRQVKRLGQGLGVTSFSSETSGQEFMERQEGTGPAANATQAPESSGMVGKS